MRSAYVECGWDGVEGPATAFGAAGDAAFGGGKSENKDGDGAWRRRGRGRGRYEFESRIES